MQLNNNQEFRLTLENGDTLVFNLKEFSTFFNQCLSLKIDFEDFEDLFLDITDSVIDDTPDDERAKDLKLKLNFLKNLNFLFKGLVFKNK